MCKKLQSDKDEVLEVVKVSGLSVRTDLCGELFSFTLWQQYLQTSDYAELLFSRLCQDLQLDLGGCL